MIFLSHGAMPVSAHDLTRSYFRHMAFSKGLLGAHRIQLLEKRDRKRRKWLCYSRHSIIVISCLDYCNVFYMGLPLKSIRKL